MSDAAKKLKESVLTPKTDFPMKADLTSREVQTLERWYSAQPDGSKDLYEAIQKRRSDAPLYVLHDGPPYANGDAHTGTGMNKILKDTVVKYQTMLGNRSPYIPGWDCHGLPIEHKVLEELGGKKPEDMSALEVRERCLAFAHSFIDRQREQFKRTMTLGRWEEPYLTINPIYEGAVLDCFADLMRQGYVSRSRKPVHWSWAARSALAEAELEYEEREDPSIYVKFRMRFEWDGEQDDTWRFGDLPDSFFESFLPAGMQQVKAPEDAAIACRIHAAKNRLDVLKAKLGGLPVHFVIWTTTPW
ncbi:MAG: class I tRNA ligase family protein, partial [Planctomycetes bacterium]|nr:class I tRNA ligase family protein [Planctomycetota bacterium]